MKDADKIQRSDGSAAGPREQGPATCEEIRDKIIDVVIGSSAAKSAFESLDPRVKAHLTACAECSAYLADLISVQEAAARRRDAAERVAAESLEPKAAGSPYPSPLIASALEEGLARRNARSARGRASLLENLAFFVFAVVVLSCEAAIFAHYQPTVVFAAEVLLNWLAPFTFYVIFSLDRRASHRKGTLE